MEELTRLLAVNGYIPHGYCLSWSPTLVGTFVISDVLIFLSYFSMPVALGYFARKRQDFPYRWLLWLFSAFIMACGTTHLMGAIVLWEPMYALDALLKAGTAVISVVTAIALWPLLPHALKLPSPTQLKKANEALQGEIAQRKRVEGELRVANAAAKVNLERNVSLLAAIVESSGEAIIGKAIDGSVTSWNHAAQTIFGYAADEMIGQRQFSLVPQGHAQEEAAFLAGIQRSQSATQFETHFERKDGQLIAVSVTVSPIRDLDNQAMGVSVIARDITEREQAQAALRESEARFRSLSDMSSDFYWESDAEHRLVARDSANKKLSMDSMFQRGAQIGERRWEIPYLSPDETVWQAHRAELDAHRPFREFELSRLGADGTERHISINGDPMFDATGVFKGYRGVGTDITERKRFENALRESELNLRAIFDGALDGIVVADAHDRKFLAANSAICDTLGYTREEVLELRVPSIHPEEGMPRVAEHFNRMLQGDLQLATDMPVMRKDGSVFYADIKATPIRFGGKDAVLGIFRDVSERIKSEQQIFEAEAQYRSLVEQSIAGTYVVQDGKFAYVNPRFAEIFGYDSSDEMIGLDALSIAAEQDRGTMAENIRQRIEGEIKTIKYDFVGLRKDGSTVDIGLHGARATHRGRPAVIGMVQDISEKKRAEEEIRAYITQLETAFMSTVEVATNLGEMRDPYTAGHQRRVAELAVAIGAELGFDERRREGLRVAGYLHDIGKITIPAEILSKPGKLSAIEFQLIQTHAQAGYDVLKGTAFPWPVAQVALQHHERMDGSGYPQGLKGDAILLEARIMTVADVVEAMSSHRPYRPGLGIDKALAEVERGRGTLFDAGVVDACLRLFREKGYSVPE